MQYLSFGWQGNSASGTTLGVTANQHVSANIALVAVASDNTSTGADGDNSEVSGISDTASHTWTKVGEYTNTEGAAAAGATISLWMATLKPSNAGKSTTFTATWVSTRAARNVIIYFFKSDTESSWAVAEVLTAATDASTNYGSLTNSALSSKQRLYLRVSAQESSTTGTYTPTSGFTQLANNNQSTTGMGVRGEFKIATSTGETSNPTNSFTSDTASVYVAFEDDPVGGEQRATQVVPVSVTTTLLVATDAEVTQISGTSIGIVGGREAEVTQISATSIGIVEGRSDNVTQIVMYSITSQPIPTPPTTVLGLTAFAPVAASGSIGSITVPTAVIGLAPFVPAITASQVANIEVPIVEIGYTAFAPDPPIPTFPTATSTPTATPSSTPTSSVTATPSPTSTNTVTATPSPTATSSVTATPSPTETSSATATPSCTPTASSSTSTSASISASGTNTSSASASVSASSSASCSATTTPSGTSSVTSTTTPSGTSSVTSTSTPSLTPSATSTSTSSGTPTTTATGTEEPPPDFDCCCCCSPIPGVVVIVVIR